MMHLMMMKRKVMIEAADGHDDNLDFYKVVDDNDDDDNDIDNNRLPPLFPTVPRCVIPEGSQ